VLTLKWDQRFESGFLQQRVYELSVPERRTLNDKCRGAIVIITHRARVRGVDRQNSDSPLSPVFARGTDSLLALSVTLRLASAASPI
jgi:hypothetical protein